MRLAEPGVMPAAPAGRIGWPWTTALPRLPEAVPDSAFSWKSFAEGYLHVYEQIAAEGPA